VCIGLFYFVCPFFYPRDAMHSARGVATGIYRYYIPPKLVDLNFLRGTQMTSERLLNISIEVLYPKNIYPPPKKNFLHTPLHSARCLRQRHVCLSVRRTPVLYQNKEGHGFFTVGEPKHSSFRKYAAHPDIRKGSPRARAIYETGVGTNNE